MESQIKPSDATSSYNESKARGDDRNQRINGANSSQSSFFVVDLILRLLAIGATLAAAIVMGTNKQTVMIPLPLGPGGATVFAPLHAKYHYSPAFIFFVVANAIACGYTVLSLIPSVKGKLAARSGSYPRMSAFHLAVADMHKRKEGKRRGKRTVEEFDDDYGDTKSECECEYEFVPPLTRARSALVNKPKNEEIVDVEEGFHGGNGVSIEEEAAEAPSSPPRRSSRHRIGSFASYVSASASASGQRVSSRLQNENEIEGRGKRIACENEIEIEGRGKRITCENEIEGRGKRVAASHHLSSCLRPPLFYRKLRSLKIWKNIIMVVVSVLPLLKRSMRVARGLMIARQAVS